MSGATHSDAPQPLVAHLIELRRRLIWCLAFFVIAFVACYELADHIYDLLAQPLLQALDAQGKENARQFIYTSLTEAFVTYVRVAAWAALFVTFPVILVQVWKFIAPGLYRHERRALGPFLAATPILFGLGAALAYFMVIPLAYKFFLSFEQVALPGQLPITLEARMGEYLNLTMSLLFAFGAAFELPIFLLLLVRFGIIPPEALAKKRRYAIVIIFAAAAVLTPPDVFSQLCLAIPLMALYEASVIAARFLYPNIPASDELTL
jgi:sec-independent protein translocase protein TatC